MAKRTQKPTYVTDRDEFKGTAFGTKTPIGGNQFVRTTTRKGRGGWVLPEYEPQVRLNARLRKPRTHQFIRSAMGCLGTLAVDPMPVHSTSQPRHCTR